MVPDFSLVRCRKRQGARWLSVVGVLLLGVPLAAQTLVVGNHSFEDTPLAENQFVFSANGWVSSGGGTSAGTFNPAVEEIPVMPDGSDNLAFVNGQSGLSGFYQVLGDPVQANSLYTLTVDVGDRASTEFPSNVSIRLGAGSTWGDSLFPVLTSSTPTPSLGWEVWQVSYRSDQFSEYVGSVVRIELNADSVQALFDNVRVQVSAVPEASTVWWATLPIVAGMVLRLRQRGRTRGLPVRQA